MKQGAAIMPDALRWLWRGVSEPDRGEGARRYRQARMGSARQGLLHRVAPTSRGSRWARPTAP